MDNKLKQLFSRYKKHKEKKDPLKLSMQFHNLLFRQVITILNVTITERSLKQSTV